MSELKKACGSGVVAFGAMALFLLGGFLILANIARDANGTLQIWIDWASVVPRLVGILFLVGAAALVRWASRWARPAQDGTQEAA